MKPSIALIGPGKVGCAIAHRLHKAGYRLKAVVGRDRQQTLAGCHFIGCPDSVASTELRSAVEAEIILLAVPDDQIEALATTLQGLRNLSAEQTLVHFSGLHRAAIMRVAPSNLATLSIHPLLPFANRQLASERLTDCPCALEGDESAIALGEKLVNAFGGQPFRIKSADKALYHTSACIASNFLVTLLSTATTLLEECGIEPDQAINLLLPLVQASVDNLAQLGAEQGLTGPIVRGDSGTVAAHLAALKTSPTGLLPLYRLLGIKTVELAETSTRLSHQQAESLRQLINPVSCD